MSINIGSNPFGLYLGSTKIREAYIGSTKIYSSGQPGFPANTLRFQFSNTSYTPTVGSSGCTATKGSWTAYDTSSGIWDWTCNDASWADAFKNGLASSVIGYGNNAELILGSSTITATNMNNMFRNCDRLISVQLFDTSSVTSMRFMFWACSNLTGVPLFNTSSVTNMDVMFYGCRNLTTVPLIDTSSVTSMANMFEECYSLTSVPLFDTSSVDTIEYMFSKCSSLTSVPLFDTSSAIYMSQMFRDCSSLTSIPLFDTSSATDMSIMFYNCTSLTSVPLLNTSRATNMNWMFYNCTNVASGALALYQQASTQATPPSSHNGCFSNCGIDTVTGAAELAQIPTSWGGTMSA